MIKEINIYQTKNICGGFNVGDKVTVKPKAQYILTNGMVGTVSTWLWDKNTICLVQQNTTKSASRNNVMNNTGKRHILINNCIDGTTGRQDNEVMTWVYEDNLTLVNDKDL